MFSISMCVGLVVYMFRCCVGVGRFVGVCMLLLVVVLIVWWCVCG